MSTPFSDDARALHESGLTYAQMAYYSMNVRSQSWWNTVVRFGAVEVLPPSSDEEIKGIAELFGRPEERVRSMIAEEWYGVAPGRTSARVRYLAPQIDALDEEDADLVDRLVGRVSRKEGAEESKPRRGLRIVRRRSAS